MSRFEHWIYSVPLRLKSIFRRVHVEDELAEELEFHIEYIVQQEIAKGRSPEEARRVAVRAMDGLELRKEECRDMRSVKMLENLLQDLRYAWRGLLKRPGFTAVAVLTLALGIGANSAIFSVINAALLKPLPYPSAERLMLVFETYGERIPVSYANFADWQREGHGFQSMAAGRRNTFTLGSTGSSAPERIEGGIYSWALFQTLGVQPLLGRGFSEADDRTGAPRVAVISYELWQHRFDGAPDILHRQIRLDGVPCEIIGVMPRGFGYPARDVEVWTPIRALFGDTLQERSWHQLFVVARLRDGVNALAAVAEIDAIQQRLLRENRGSLVGKGATGVPLRALTTRESRTSLYVLLGGVACLLLIACVNVSNLLVARGSLRMREFSVRLALGAGRSRLIRQLLTESLLLSLLGTALGLILGYGLTSVLGTHAEAVIPAGPVDTSAPIRMDPTVLSFTAALSILVGIAAGLLPARRSSRAELSEGLREGGRSATSGHSQQRLRTTLISAEVALSFVLLVVAGLMIRSFTQLQNVKPGMSPDHLVTAAISLPDGRYPAEPASRFSKTLLEKARALAGVETAALVTCLPVDGYCGDNGFSIEGRPQAPGEFNGAMNLAASPGYFQLAGIPLLAGRDFTALDGRGFDRQHPQLSALVISQSMARKYWPDGHALGQRVYFGDEHSPRYEVIGIVGDVLIDLEQRPEFAMYTPLFEGRRTDFFLVLRTAGNSAGLASSIRVAVKEIDPEIPAYQIRTMPEVLSHSTRNRSFTALVLGSFAGLALVLSAVGLYGVLSFLIAQRTPEIGIRIALGATRAAVCRLALAQGLKPACVGLAIGFVAALALTRMMQSILFGVKAIDPITFAGAPLVMLLAALAACLVPIWRAANTDPIQALRSE